MSIKIERKLQKAIEKDGGFSVRSCSSHTPIDLVTFKEGGDVKLVQVKETNRPFLQLAVRELKRLREISDRFDANVTLFIKFPSGCVECPIKELSENDIFRILPSEKLCRKVEMANDENEQ